MKKDSFQELDDLLVNKAFDELSSSEKEWVLEHLDANQYEKLRALVTASKQDQILKTSPKTKDALMAQMKAKRKPAAAGIFSFQVPAYAASLVLALVVAVLLIFRPVKEVPVEKIVTVASEPLIDTVFVNQIDTIYIDKRVEVPVYITKLVEPIKEEKEIQETLSNKSLADQEDIRSLLVQSK